MSYPPPQVPPPPQPGFAAPPPVTVPPSAPIGSEPPLDQPWPGIPYKQAWIRFWKKGATFTGRASRSEYWKIYFTLLVPAVIQMVMGIIAVVRASSSFASTVNCYSSDSTTCAIGVSPFFEFTGTFGTIYLIWTIIYWLIGLACIVPSLALGWRRMHDTNKAGPFVLIPIAGDIIFAAQAPHPAGARFDEGARPYGYGYGFPGAWYPPGAYPPPAPNQLGAGSPWVPPPAPGMWTPPAAPYYPHATPGGAYPPADARYGVAPVAGTPYAPSQGFGPYYGPQAGGGQPYPPPPAAEVPPAASAAPEQLFVSEPPTPGDFSPDSVESPVPSGEQVELGESEPSATEEAASEHESGAADSGVALSPVEAESATVSETESVPTEVASVPASEGIELESIPASVEAEPSPAEPPSAESVSAGSAPSSDGSVPAEPEFTFAPAAVEPEAAETASTDVADGSGVQAPADDDPETAFSPVSDGEHPVSSPPLSTVAETTEIPYLTAFPGSPAMVPDSPTHSESSTSSAAPSSAFYPAGGEEDRDATTRITGPSIPGSRGWGASETDDAAPAAHPAWVLHLDEDREIPVTGKVVLGRSPQLGDDMAGATAVSIKDISLSASKTHAFFELRDDALFVTDLGSTNGSRVTDSDGVETILAARTEYRVEPGSIVRLGDYAIGVTQRAE